MRRSSASSRRATNQGQQRQRARPARLLLALLARATSFICRDLLAALKNRLSTWRREIVDALTPALERMRFEPLEPRLLMSADPVSVLAPPPAADAQTAPDSHPTERRADIAMAAAPAALAAANAQASVSVTGAGTAQLTRADDGSYTLAVRGTDAASRVTLQTDGAGSHALLTALSTDSAVGALDLGLADLQGNAQLAGPVGTLVLGDLDGASIALTGTSANLRLGNVTDSSLLAGQTQLQLEADSWTGNGSLQAASLTRLAVHGSFDAALLVAPPGTAAMVLTGVNIEGSASGAWNIQGRTGNVQIGSTSPSWRAQFQAPVTQIYIVGDASGTLAAPAIQVLQVGGSMRGMSVLVGANLGADLALGGSGANADSFKAGTLARLRVIGDIVDSRVHIGVDPTTGAVLGAAGNRVQELVVVGALSGSTQLVAPAFPATVRVGGQSVAPNTLPQLQVVASDTTAPVLSAALRSDSGASASDGITNDPTLALQASDALGVTGFEARIDASGSAAYTAITPTAVTGGYTLGAAALAQLAGGTLADGAHVVELRAIDAAGNRSAVARVAFTLDTTAPAATVQLAPASDTGTVGDRQTTLASVTLRGTTGAGTRVQLGSATTTADSTGAFAFSNVALAVGSNSFSFTLTDAAGNTGTASLAVTRTAIPVDTTPPSVNTLALVSDTGSSTTDGITRDPRVQGTVSDNVAVTRLLVALDPTATPTYTDLSAALNAGAFSLSAAQLNTLAGGTLAQGAHTLSVVAVDAAGNRSTARTLTFTLDTVAPTATVGLAPESDTGTVGDRQTTLSSVTLRGTTGAGTRVQLGSATTTADNTGAFAFNNVALAVGSNSFSFTLTDAAGNTGTASLTVTRTAAPGDTTAPRVNTLALVSDTGSSTTDGITRDPRVQGTVSDNVAVTRLLVALDPAATPTYTDLSAALNAGAFTLSAAQLNTLAGGTLAQGAHTLSVVAVDAAGNRSTARTLTFTLDTVAPTATVGLAPESDTGTVGDRQTTLSSVTLRGTTGAGTRVQLGSATTTADNTGAFAFNNVALAVGSNSFSFTLTDAAGNTGTASLAVTRTAIPVDTTPPSVNTLALVSDTGSSTTDGITRDPRVQGTVSDNVAVTRLLVALDPTATPTYTDLSAALNAGAFTLTAAQLATLAGGTLGQGAHTLSVIAVDAAGNRSTARTLTFTLDTVAPTATVGLAPESDTGTVGDRQTTLASVTLQGTTGAGTRVQLGSASTTADNTGAFAFNNVPLAVGSNSFSFTLTDAAGNTGTASLAVTRTAIPVDTTPPSVNTLALVSDTGSSTTDGITRDPRVQGTVSDNVAVTRLLLTLDAGTEADLSSALNAGAFTLSAAQLNTLAGGTLAQGAHTLSVVAVDAAGNRSTARTLAFTLDTSAPTAAIGLAPASDTGTVGDLVTESASVTLVGTAAAGTVVQFGARQATADAAGGFSFTGVALALGSNSFAFTLTDPAGNTGTASVAVQRSAPTTVDTQAPVVATLSLVNDSGRSATDGITNDVRIAGTVTDNVAATRLLVALDPGATPTFTNLSAALGTGGAFSITAAQLATLAGGTLAQGAHTLRVVAEDAAGNRSAAVNLAFTLDSVAPTGGSFGVSITDAVGGNTSQSDAAIAVLAGTVEANATVTLAAQGLSVVASGTGAFQLPGVALAEGDNRITLGVLDAAGNSTSIVRTITRVAPSTFADPVLAWNQIALQSIQRDVTTPEEATRILAMQSLAVYDTLAAIDGTAAYMVQDKVTGPVSVEAAVAQAAYQILYAFYPSQRGILDAALASSLATIADGAAKTAGIALGERVAKAIVVIRANDGYLDYAIDDGGTALGQWRPTGPMYLVAEHPQWGSVTPFALDSADQFRAPPPPALTSAEYAAAEEQVRLYGGETSALRTADQTQMAQFWADGGGSYTPPGHWNLIAQQIAASKGAGLAANARMMAQLNVALADAAIACWDTKYTYDFWRPVTAIHNADLDNNPGTQVDANWRPLLITPPHPDYVSGHSTFSAAAAGILSATFGANTAFSTISVTVPGVTRSFTSFQQAAQEAGMSRIYAGIHTIFANNEGAVIGGKVADAVLARFALTEDTQAPNIVLADSPANTNANLVLTGQVLDNLSGVASLQYRVDNGALTNLARASDGSFTITTALALNGSADGAHSITLVARDAAGNTSAGTTRSFVLDTRAPTVALASIAANAVLDANSRLVGQADATGTAVVALSYSFDGGAAKTITYDSATGRFDQALPLGDLSVGAHSLRLVATDAAGNSTTLVRSVSIAELAPFTITKFTPEDAKREIGSTFRPQVFFSRAVNAATLTADSLYATGPDGSKLAMTIVPALDGSFAWLLPQSPMPGGSTITLHVKGSAIRAAQDGAFLDAGGNGTAGGDFTWTFTTVSTTAVIGTKLVGRVVDPGADLLPMTFDDIRRGPDGVIHTPDDVFLNPIAGAKVWIIGQEDKVVYTDAQGFFELDGVPVGNVKLAIDGRTATNPPAGIFFPEMVMDLDLKPGIANTAMGSMGKEESRIENADRREIYLPRVQSSALQPVSDTATTVITVDENSAPGIIDAWREAMTLTVTPGAAIGFDGQPLANVQIGINTVPPELVREMLPPGVLEHTFDITIQAPGVDTFAAPLKITFPNVFNSAPGTKLNVMSFDHTTGRLVINGTATVSADGLTVVSDEGSGILAPGWHGLTPPGPRGGNDKPRPPTPPNPPTPPLPPLPPLPPVPPIIPWFPLPWTPVPPIGPTTPPNQSTPTPGIVSPIGGTPNRFTGFNIDLVDVTQTLTPAQEVAVGQAIGVWESIITTDIPSALTVYGLVDDLRIDLRVVAGDGAGGTLGGATILERRPGSMGLPALAEITIDVADLAAATPAELRAIMLHEIGHALGLGELWAGMGLVNTTVAGNPRYTGAAGVAAFSALMGSPQTSVPLDNRSGASPTHWRESVFGNELMTPLLDSGIATPLSALTVAALADMGYTVNTAAAQAYTLPGAGFPFHPGTLQPANTTDGELLQADAGGAGLAVVAAAATLDDHVFRAFDFGAGGTAAGFTAVGAAQVYSTASGYGWRTANSASSATTGGNALTGDFAQTRDATFSVAVANGTYDIVLTLGDDASARDRMSYELQGVRRGAVSTVAGEHITMTHRVEVHNGVLDLRLFSEFGPVALNALEVHQVSDYVTPASSVSYTSGHYYFAIHNLDTGLVMRDNTVVAEGGAVCPDGVVLAPNTRYRQYVYHVETNTIGISDYVTPASGNDFDLPEIVLGGRFTPDADADGLEDLAEFIVGTRADRRDTDGDGIADRAELQQQLDPLGGLSIQPGVVASAALLGTAQAVAVSGTGGDTGASLTAYVATGSYGLAVVDVSQTTAPAVRAQLDLSGNNVDVAVDAVRQLALVAAGDAGLHIVDVRDPTAPVLRQTLVFDGSVQNVRIRDGLAFVSAGANLAVVDLNTGDVLQTLNLANQGGGAVTGLALDGATLYSMDSTRTLRSFAIAGNQLATRDTLALAEGGTQIFAGGGVVYVGTGTSFQQGFLTVNAADPANLVLLSGVDQAGTAGQSLAANGSGLLVSVGALRGPVGQALNVLDVSNVRDPANTGAFVTRYNLPNPPEGVALANGFAFVAGGAGGLQIVSYIGFDAAGVAPTLSVAIDGVDADPSTPGIQVLEGRNVQIRPTVVDDVQVRNVELLVNGVVVSNDAAFPFELLAQVPTIASGGNQMTLQVRATDTGGNVTLSAVTTLRVVPDTFAPLLQSINLAEGARRFFVRSVDLQFDEPLDTARLAASGVTLLRAGADGRFGTADDVRVAVRLDTRAFGQALSILPESFLTAGEYRLTITPSIVADRAGNALAAPIVRNFTVRPASNVQAAVGLPEVAQAPSANPGQEIGINVPFDPSTARAQFTTLDANGTRATTVVNARRFDAATGTAYFMVPFNAASGDIVVYGQEGSVRTDFDDGTLPLQIVPIVSGVQVQSVASDGSSAVIVLTGMGFAEGNGSEYRIGGELVTDGSVSAGPNVTDRYDPVLNQFIANGSVTLTVPLSAGVFGAISVRTVGGGTSASYSVSLSSITSVALSGTPANAALASANAGQAIVLNGTGLSTGTDVLLRYTDYQGNLSMVRVSPTSAAGDGTRATLVLPANVNGAFALQVFGSATQPVLQIVPTLHAFTENGFMALSGSGFVEGASTITLPGATVADTATNAGVDVTYGYDAYGVYGENNLANIPLANTPRYGQGSVTLSTAGGTSAALALNLVRPGSNTAPTGLLSDIAVDRSTGATWVLDSDNPDHLLRINTATGAIVQSITLTSAMGPYTTSQGYAGLQINPGAFSLGGVNVPAGSLVLLNGYGRNHVTALNPATGAVIAQLDLAGSYITSGVLDAATGRIFATTNENTLGEFNATTGALVQSFDLPFNVTGRAGMAIDPASGNLWIGSQGSGTSIVLVNRQGQEIRRVDLASQGVTNAEISGLAFLADGTLRVASTQGTVAQVTLTPDIAVQAATLSAITAAATDGVPAQAGVASANVGQLITLSGTNFNSGTRVLFGVRYADGSTGQVSVNPLAINDAGTRLQVLVPELASTGDVRVVNRGTRDLAGSTSWTDSVYRNVTVSFTAGASTAAVRFADGGLQGVNDESWGIDNVRVARGATTVFSDDFEGAANAAWSNAAVDLTERGTLTRFAGRFSNDSQTLNLTGLTAGQTYTLRFDLYVLDSWAASNANDTDLFEVSVDGVNRLRESFANADTAGGFSVQSFGASAAVRLQIVPTLTGVEGRPGENAVFTLNGSGFMEGASTVTVGGVAFVDDAGTLTPFDVSGPRNSSMTAVAPRTLDGPVRITTEGGYAQITPQFGAQPLSLFTAIVASANNAGPANNALPSANTAQTIVLQGQGFTNATLVQFQGRDDTGATGTLTRTGSASADGRTLSVIVPAQAVTGNVSVLGSGNSIALQVVPLVRSVGGTIAAGNTIVLEGIGLSAADLAITVGGRPVTSYTLRTVIDGVGTTRDLQLVTLTVPTGAVGREVSVATSGGGASMRTGALIANLGAQTPAADPSDTAAGAASLGALRDARLTINATVGDGANGQRDVDLYSVTLGARVMLRVNMTTATYGTVRLFDAAGNEVATRTFSPNDASVLQFTAPNTGTYTIGVSGLGNTSYNPASAGSGTASPYTGAYSLNVEAQSLGSVRLATVLGTAAEGTPGNTAVASANPGQAITLTGAGLVAGDRIVFMVVDAAGNIDELAVTPTSVDVAAQTITVTVPDTATTGRLRLERDTNGMLLQIVPRVTDVQVQSVASDGSTATVVLSGYGFLDGADSLYRFGSYVLKDAGADTGPDVQGRSDPVRGFIANGQVTVTVPLSDGVFGGISVQTVGGTSTLLSRSLASITAVAASGTPANAAQASANAGQSIVLNGSGLSTATDVLIRYTDYQGNPSMVRVSPTTAAADGSRASLTVPLQVNGAYRLQVFGSASQPLLQIVPTLRLLTEDGTLHLAGSGFAEGGTTLVLPGATLVDRQVGIGADITYGYDVAGNYLENHLINVSPEFTPRYGQGNVSVRTAGGTSAPLASNVLRPGSDSAAAGNLSDIAVNRTTGATWVLDGSNPGRLLRIDPATGAIAQTIVLTTAMGPYVTAQGYAGLQINPSAFSLGGVSVPAGSLVLVNGYGRNHVTALNPATGAVIAQLDLAGSYLTSGVLDASTGRIFATTSDNRLSEFNAATGALVQGVTLPFTVTGNTGMAIDPASGHLWVGASGTGTSIVLLNRAGVEQRRVDLASQGIDSGEISGLAFAPDGTLRVSSTRGTVYSVTVA